MWPGILWLVFKSIPADYMMNVAGIPLPASDSLANAMVALFAAAWFRFVITEAAPKGKKPALWRTLDFGIVARFVTRSVLIVFGVSALLILPTIVLAVGWIFLTRPEAITHDVTTEAVGVAFPLAMLMLSPFLVRLYAYYAAVLAGRHDVTPVDAWRWMRGKSIQFVGLIAGVLAPALLCLSLVEKLGLGPIGYGLAMPLLFASVALAAAACARAMAGLIAPPLQAVAAE